jgi:DNA-binding transcriptional LysR family regulator
MAMNNLRFLRIELSDLRSFVVLAEERSFTRAAAIVGKAQPSLSRQIKKLELELGAELFHRTKRSVVLTPVGRSVLTQARSVLSQASITFDVARLSVEGAYGELRIGFIEAAAFALLPRLISSFRRSYPNVAVKLIELGTLDQVTALREHAIDLGILRAPIPSDDVETVPLFREAAAVALPSKHPLVKQPSIRLASLRNEDFIFHSSEKTTRLCDEITALTRQQGYVPRIVQEAGEFHTICSLVAGGLGISVVPSSAQAIRILGVSYRKLTHPVVVIEYCLGWLKGSRGPHVKAFQSIL